MTDPAAPIPFNEESKGGLVWMCQDHGKLSTDDVVYVRGELGNRRLCMKCLVRLIDKVSIHLAAPVYEAKLERTP